MTTRSTLLQPPLAPHTSNGDVYKSRVKRKTGAGITSVHSRVAGGGICDGERARQRDGGSGIAVRGHERTVVVPVEAGGGRAADGTVEGEGLADESSHTRGDGHYLWTVCVEGRGE